jgi:hypothetical protein
MSSVSKLANADDFLVFALSSARPSPVKNRAGLKDLVECLHHR